MLFQRLEAEDIFHCVFMGVLIDVQYHNKSASSKYSYFLGRRNQLLLKTFHTKVQLFMIFFQSLEVDAFVSQLYIIHVFTMFFILIIQ